jgi:Sulfotransferase family
MSEGSRLQATDYTRTPMRVLNTALRAANSIGLARISLDNDSLITAARKATGLKEFGDESFFEALGRLVDATEAEADLNPIGRFMARTSILRLLKHRLYAHDLLTRHPEILERQIPDPVVVLGLGRSGTTRLHRLLAADDRFLHLTSWESVFPVPTPECFAARTAGRTDPRITALNQGLKAVMYMSPQVGAVHPLGTFEVEEELGLLQHAFSSQIFELLNRVPSFGKWLEQHNQNAAYEYMVVLMKIISWFRNDPEDKPWVLKTPQHMQDLDALLHVFPNSKLVCPHRDPIKAVGSICSTAWNAMVRDCDSIDPHAIGRHWMDKTEWMLHKTLRIRAESIPPQQQYDIQYAGISADWQREMQGVYDFLGLPFTDAARVGMQAWLDRNNQHQHGAHKYRLEDFGLDKEGVDRRLMFYRERFNIPYETKNPHLATAAS